MGSGTVVANGVTLWYEGFGEGTNPHVVLIMGATASALSWNATFYELLVAAGYHVVRFDNRDVGLSEWFDTTDRYTLDDMAADTLGLMDALSIDRAHLIGVSMGGMIAQVMALQHPERVLTLTSICSSPDPTDATLGFPSDAVIEQMMTPLPDAPEDLVDQLVHNCQMMAGERPCDEGLWRARFEAEMVRGFNPNPGHARAAGSAPSRRASLASLDLPTLVIHGDADPVTLFAHGVATADAIPSATLLRLRGVGHVDILEPPDEVIPAVLAHLTRAAS